MCTCRREPEVRFEEADSRPGVRSRQGGNRRSRMQADLPFLISANSTTLRVGDNQCGILPRASQEPEGAFEVSCILEAGTLRLSEGPRCG